jgi:uncharacterized protein (DUF1499 family)
MSRALRLSLASVLLLALGPLGTRVGAWSLGVGFGVVAMSLLSGLVGAAASLVGGVRTREWGRAVGGIVAGLLAAGVLGLAALSARGAPAIHDITTDMVDPPVFVASLPLRAAAANSAEYGGPAVAEQQRRAYPDIQPMTVGVDPQAAFARARATARDLGWEVVGESEAEGRIEAVDTTFWFGFKDDVVIRVRGMSGGTRVDARSTSRVGRGDLGTNARRVRAFLRAMETAR